MTTTKRNVMQRSTSLVAGFVAVTLALAPAIAEARAGDGRSMGSRGSMTYSAPPSTRTAPGGSQPMQRSMTQPSMQGNQGAFGGSPAAPARSGGFMSGLMGGLIGAGIGGLLFGHGFWGGGLGFGGFFGFLIQMLLLVLLVRFLFRIFANRKPAMAGGPDIFARNAQNPATGAGWGGGGRATPPPVQIGQSDYQQFEQLLQSIQAAWTAQNLAGLQAMATPEMVSYFNEQLSEQASRGVRNQVTDVRLVSGDLSQAWTEQGRDYATVAMRFSMVDVTRDVSGRIVDGNPNEHVTATELWTFVRARGGQWILSAIQQTR